MPLARSAVLMAVLLAPLAQAALPSVTITETEIVIQVTPGGSVAFMIYGARPNGRLTGVHVTPDTDGDGTIRYQRPPAQYPQFTVLVADVATGAFDSATTAPAADAQPLPPRTVLRGPTGEFTWILLPAAESQIIWLRPGVGAWSAGWGSAAPTINDIRFFETSMFAALNSVPRPAGFALGDRLLVLNGFDPFAGAVDADVNAPDSGGAVTLVKSVPGLHRYGEGQQNLVTLVRTGGSQGPASVSFEQTGGTAVAGVHYQFPPPVTFAAGELFKSVPIGVIDDGVYSGRTFLDYRLANVTGMTLGEVTTREAYIEDDEPAPLVQFGNVPSSMQEGDAPRTLEIPLTKSGATRVPASVQYSWSFRGATGSGTIVFAPTEESKTIGIPIAANTTPDENAMLSVSISGPADARLPVTTDGRNRSIFVTDDDLPHVDAVDAAASEGARVTVPVEIDPPLRTRPVVVRWTTADGTARAGIDYVAGSGSDPQVSIFVHEDDEVEQPETFYVDIVEVTGGVIRKARATVTIADDPRPRVTLGHVTVFEGGPGQRTDARVPITLSRPAPAETRLRLAIAFPGGTATPSVDYALHWPPVVIAAGQTSAEGVIEVLGDAEAELDETIFINAYELEGLKRPARDVIVRILDDDGPGPRLRVHGTRILEGTGATNTAALSVQLTGPSASPVVFSYRTGVVSAAWDSDYQPVEGTVVLQPGDTTATVLVQVAGDAVAESDEAFSFTIFNTSGAAVERDSALATIVDDDTGIARASLAAADVRVREGETSATVELKLTAAAAGPMDVTYWTVAGSAAAGSDFVPVTGTVTFAPGELAKTVSVPLVNDGAREDEESFQLLLASESATLQRAVVRCTIADDDGAGKRRAARH